MRIDYDIALEVASHEAIIRQAYKDSKGIWTWSVGITSQSGHSVERYIGKPQPLEYCLRIYVETLEKYAERVRKAFAGVPLSKAQFAAALSFEWHTGAIGRAAWVKSFKRGDTAKARREFMAWNKPPEIVRRREKERALFFDGKWSNNGTMTEYTRLTARGTPDWKSGRKVNVKEALRTVLASVGAPPEPPPVHKPAGPAKADIEYVQKRLREIGYFEVGEVDGKWGPRTRGALLAFKADHGLALTPDIDDETKLILLHAGTRAVAESRAQATVADLEAKSRTVAKAQETKRVSLWTLITTAAGAVVSGVSSFFGDAASQIAPMREFIPDIPPWVWFAAVAMIAYGLWRTSGGVVERVVEDYRQGKKL